MKEFGVREVCNVKLRALRNINECNSITGQRISKGEPVVYFDYLKVSNLTGSGNTVYATGGKGNARRLSWDSDKEVTFHAEDALLSPESLAILTGAAIRKRKIVQKKIEGTGGEDGDAWELSVDDDNHTTVVDLSKSNFDKNTFIDFIKVEVTGTDYKNSTDGTGTALTGRIPLSRMEYDAESQIITFYDMAVTAIDNIIIQEASSDKVTYQTKKKELICEEDGKLTIPDIIVKDSRHPLFVFDVQSDGSMDKINALSGEDNVEVTDPITVSFDETTRSTIISHPNIFEGNTYLVDYYKEVKGNVTSLIITSEYMSEYYKLEAEGEMKSNSTGQDVAIMITMPKVKMTSNWEIPMSNTGDPSTFTFDFDVFPAEDASYEACSDNVMVIIDILDDTDDTDCVCVFK